MTNSETITKPKARKTARAVRHSPAAPKLREGGSFDHSFGLRHSTFVIRKSAIRNQQSAIL
jgi:hypothetical protein